MSYKDKCIELYERHLRNHFDSTFDTEENRKRADQMLSSEALSHVLASNDDFPKVNAFVAEMIAQICRGVLDEKLEAVIKTIVDDVRLVVDELLTEEEAKEVLDFASTQLGQKLLRNIDLLKESFFKGSLGLTTEIVARWSRPEISEAIQAYIESLNNGAEEP